MAWPIPDDVIDAIAARAADMLLPRLLEALAERDAANESAPGLLSARDGAKLLRISVATFNRLATEPGFPMPVNVGSRRRWAGVDLLAHMKTREAAPAPRPLPKTGTDDSIDVSRELRHGGLRAVGGGR